AVIQAHSQGMYNERLNFTDVLKGLYGPALKAVYDKSSAKLNEEGGAGAATDSYLYGSNAEHIVMENGHRFTIDWVQGQKTGFFLDQRDNRQLLANYAANKKILNTFCYSGGFSVYGLKAGASLVHSVDSSAKAIELTDANIRLNEFDPAKHQSYTSDVFEFLKGADTDYDIIILDPPAFAKGHSARHSAIKAYTRLNLTALQKIKPGGLVFTFSCSQVVDRDMFAGAVTAAAIESGRDIKILHHLTQPADHPVSIYNPEGLYLKGLVLYAGE
ncbi:MAG TPA: class I SAM-dependent rRNA methyltransferase, partial [Chitinophagales bacterium]|nr:class I SAM-dependent rRNA methyltransferase [Chitinophagales bacterium]